MSFSHLSLPMPCLPLLFEQSLHNQIRSLPELGQGSSHTTAVEKKLSNKAMNGKKGVVIYLMSHDEFHRIGIPAKFTRKIFSIAFLQVVVHRIFSKLAQHVSQIFSVVFRVVDTINKTAPGKIGVKTLTSENPKPLFLTLVVQTRGLLPLLRKQLNALYLSMTNWKKLLGLNTVLEWIMMYLAAN